MPNRPDDEKETNGARDARRRELRDLLVSAAEAARQARQDVTDTLGRVVTRALGDRGPAD